MTQASVGFQCPECAQRGQQKVYRGPQALRPTAPVVSYVLIALNLVVFVAGLGQDGVVQIGQQMGRVNDLWAWQGSLYGPNVAAGDWWRPITAGFIHADLWHVGMNMLLLYLLGQMVEPALGKLGFLSVYMASLLGGSLAVLVISPDERTLGASGAVFGLMGAAFVGLRSRGIDPFQTAIGPLLLLNLGATFLIPNISIGGHVGGLVAGAAVGWLMFELAPRLPVGKVAAPVVVALVAVAFYGLCLSIPTEAPAEVIHIIDAPSI